MKFLELSDLPKNWEKDFENEEMTTFYTDIPFDNIYYCLHFGKEHENCFYLATDGIYCLIERAEPNSHLGERKVRALLQDMKWKNKLMEKELQLYAYSSIPEFIKNIFKGNDIHKNTTNLNLLLSKMKLHNWFLERI